ncbi:MAG: hypothetical protein JRG93_21385 [Deltaproteobacteria bacterium]|nr:hypothetical protein [Deltaproteobacteria bacterium]
MTRSQQLRRTVLASSIALTIILAVWVGLSVARFVAEGWWLPVLIALPLGVAAIDFVTGTGCRPTSHPGLS